MNKSSITLRGVVIPIDWDENGKVTATALATPNEDEYAIAVEKKGREFFSILQETVEIKGTCKTVGDKKIVLVKDYKIIERRPNR